MSWTCLFYIICAFTHTFKLLYWRYSMFIISNVCISLCCYHILLHNSILSENGYKERMCIDTPIFIFLNLFRQLKPNILNIQLQSFSDYEHLSYRFKLVQIYTTKDNIFCHLVGCQSLFNAVVFPLLWHFKIFVILNTYVNEIFLNGY